MARHPDLPPAHTAAWLGAWALLLSGALLIAFSAAHFAGAYEYDADVAFLIFVAGVIVFVLGLLRRWRVPDTGGTLARVYRREPAVPMALAIRLVSPRRGEVQYVADLWRRGDDPALSPALEVLLHREEGGIPWFTALPDGMVVGVHGAERRRGPVVVDVRGRLLFPPRPSAVWRRGQRGGGRWRRARVSEGQA